MSITGSSLKWTAVIVAITLILVLSGYFTGLLFSGKNDKGEAHAENAYNEQEESVNIPPVTDTTVNLIQGEVAATSRLTDGKCCSTRLVEDGAVNILIMGEDKVSYLYDTIGIVSIDKACSTVKLIMIPRDTYIGYNSEIMDLLREEGKIGQAGVFKINFAHHIGTMLKYKGKFSLSSISFLAVVVEEKLGVEVDDYIKINTEGFVEFVNLFGGVDLNVPYDMDYDDPTQELYIHLDKGKQHLDGRQAEGFVRFRQGYREDGTEFQIGDVGRKKNQISFLKEFIRQHGSLANIDKIPRMFKILGKNMKSSIGFGDVLKNLYRLGQGYNCQQI